MAKSTVPVIEVTDKKLAKKIDKAAKIKAKIDELKAEFNTLREEVEDMTDAQPGKHSTGKHFCTISNVPKYSDIDPIAFQNALIEEGKGERFREAITVKVSNAQKLLGTDIIDTLREEVGSTVKMSFK